MPGLRRASRYSLGKDTLGLPGCCSLLSTGCNQVAGSEFRSSFFSAGNNLGQRMADNFLSLSSVERTPAREARKMHSIHSFRVRTSWASPDSGWGRKRPSLSPDPTGKYPWEDLALILLLHSWLSHPILFGQTFHRIIFVPAAFKTLASQFSAFWLRLTIAIYQLLNLER